jgi:hypothetical protein
LTYSGQRLLSPCHEIDLAVAVAPIVDLAHACRRRVRQVRAHGRLDDATPERAVPTGLLQREAGLGGHQGGVENGRLRPQAGSITGTEYVIDGGTVPTA